MKKAIVIYLFVVGGLVSCDGEDKGPTTFRGEVIFPEGDKRESQVRVLIGGYKSRGIGTADDDVVSANLGLDGDNRFDTIFSAMEVDEYIIGIDVLSADGNIIEESLRVGDLDCSPYNCDHLEPGQNYDLTVRVLE